MAVVQKITGDVSISGNLVLGPTSTISPTRPRTELALESLAVYPVPANQWFVFDSGQPLPSTAAADDCGVTVGTHGTGTPVITAGDVKNTASTRYARTQIALPPEYSAGQTVTIRVSGATKTTVASTSSTVDLQVYKTDRAGAVDGSDLCATSAQSINSTTFGDKDFTITSTSLEPGDILDVLLSLAYSDTATATAVTPTVTVELLCDIRG